MKKVIIILLAAAVLLGGAVLLVSEPETVTDGSAGSGTDAGQNQEAEEQPEPPATEELLLEKISRMSLEEKVGQMFLVRCPDVEPVAMIEEYQPGGLVLFSRDFKEKTPEQVRKANESYQEASRLPLIISADEEGGIVCRISIYPQYRDGQFWGPQALYADGGLERIESDTAEKCQLLKDLGLNVNLAPVADVSESPNDYIYKRTFGQDAQATAEYVSRVVSVMKDEQVGSVLKHFPGYGNNVDTHVGFSHDRRPYETFLTEDFLPFQAGIEAGAGAVLVSHNIAECMDSEYPASLSPEVHRILREELNFSGVIITDDLVMDAVLKQYGIEEAAVMAVKAGNDMLCCSNWKAQIPAVIEAVRSGEISEMRIEQSVLRVLLWKYDLGLLDDEIF